MLSFMSLLAQTPSTQPTQPGGPPSQIWMLGLIVMMGVFFLVMFRGNRSEQKKRDQLLRNMKKNDRVMTIGGVIGTVVQVKDNEVVLKVDESTNTKMTFIKRAIQQVLAEDQDLSSANK